MRRIIKIFLILPLNGPQKGPGPLFQQICIPISQACFLPSLVEIGLMVLEKIFYAVPYILLCKSLSPWSGAIYDLSDFIWRKLNLPVLGMLHTKYCLIWCSSSLEDFLSISYILLCKSLRPWGGAICNPRDFICTNLNLLVLGKLHAKYCPTGCSSSWEEDF